jgi:hypothetical protein
MNNMQFIPTHVTLKQVIVFIFLFTLVACNNKSNCENPEDSTGKEEISSIANRQLVFDKLLGTWIADDGKTFERWMKNENGTYRHLAFIIKSKDTSWNEEANVYPENGHWIFENRVKNQNQGKAVKFTSSSFTPTNIQFSNPEHDFPTDINYTVSGPDTVNAFIIGPDNNGGKDTIPFNYIRVR